MHGVAKSASRERRRQGVALRAVANDEQAHGGVLRVELDEGISEHWEAVPRLERADEADHEGVSRRRLMRLHAWPEAMGVHGVRDDVNFGGRIG